MQKRVPDHLARQAAEAVRPLVEAAARRVDVARALGANPGNITRIMQKDPYCTPAFFNKLKEAGLVDGTLPPDYAPCPDCGSYHSMRSCTRRRKRGPRKAFLVPLGDVESAREKIEKEYPGFTLKEIE